MLELHLIRPTMVFIMRFYLRLLLLLLCLSGTVQAEKSLIMGQIEAPNQSTIRLFFQHAQLPLPDTYLYEAKLDTDNRFFFVIDIEQLQKVELRYNGVDIPLEIGPAWRIELQFEGEQPWKSLTFLGERAAWNQVQVELRQKFGLGLTDIVRLPPHFELSSSDFDQIRQLSPQRFLDWAEKAEQARANFIWMYPELSDAEQRLLLQRLHYGFLSVKMLYPRYSRFREVPDNYYHFLAAATVEVPELLHAPAYRHFLEEYLYRLEEQAHLANRLSWIWTNWKTEVGDYKATELLLRVIQQDGLPRHQALVNRFFEQVESTYYRQALSNYLEQLQSIEGQQQAPDFCVKQPDSLCLKDLRGKVVYLSFWASWCAPCIDEMLKHQEKVNRLADEPIVFLYLSLDKDKAAWQNALKRFQPAGQHYWMGGQARAIQQAYQVQAVPLYFLIDQQGRFVPYSKKLSHPDFERKLQQIVEKNRR